MSRPEAKEALGVFIRAAGLYLFWCGCNNVYYQALGILLHERAQSIGWLFGGLVDFAFAAVFLKHADRIADCAYPDRTKRKTGEP